MKARDIVKQIMSEKDVGNAEFAHKLDIKPTALWQQLNGSNDNPTINRLVAMVETLGYKIIIAPVDHEVPANGYLVESSSLSENSSKTKKTPSEKGAGK